MKEEYIQTKKELEKHLQEQIKFLDDSALSFDNGFEGEAKHMAAIIRLLLHDTQNSKSLLGQLNMKSMLFWDTSIKVPDGNISLGPYEGLICINLGTAGAKYIAPLDEPPTPPRQVPFENYWNEPVLVDNKKNLFSRKDLILNLANKDGGSHIDLVLTSKYADLSRRNSLGWQDKNGNFLTDAELVIVRQIAHEILKTLKPNYPKKTNILMREGATFGGFYQPSKTKQNLKVGRNDLCPCGSGKKYKKCCGK